MHFPSADTRSCTWLFCMFPLWKCSPRLLQQGLAILFYNVGLGDLKYSFWKVFLHVINFTDFTYVLNYYINMLLKYNFWKIYNCFCLSLINWMKLDSVWLAVTCPIWNKSQKYWNHCNLHSVSRLEYAC